MPIFNLKKTLSKIANEAESMAWCGYGFLLLGRHQKALDVVLEAMRLDPLHPPSLDWILGQIYFFMKQYNDAIRVLNGEALLNSLAHVILVGAYALAGRDKEASAALVSFINQRRDELSSRSIAIENESIDALAGNFQRMWQNDADWEHLADGLRKAGLPNR